MNSTKPSHVDQIVDACLGPAIDHAQRGKIRPLSQTIDALRQEGMTYNEILARAHAARPSVDAGEWDDLMAACDDWESKGRPE